MRLSRSSDSCLLFSFQRGFRAADIQTMSSERLTSGARSLLSCTWFDPSPLVQDTMHGDHPCRHIPANTSSVLMLGQRLRRWSNITTALFHCIFLAGLHALSKR